MSLAHLDPFTRYLLVFLTVCTARRAAILNNAESHAVLLGIWSGSRAHNGWCVGRYVIMPDHIHLFARPAEEPEPLRKWVSTWKSISARQITRETGVTAPIWQRDYFDRYLRTVESYGSKWDYVRNNPVRAGLVANSADWPYQGVIHELSH